MSSDKKKTPATNDQPVKVIRQGAIAASIWLRRAPSGFPYLDYTLSRSWLSKTSGKKGYASTYFDNNEEAMLTVVRDASAFIREHRDDLDAFETEGEQELKKAA